MYCDFGLLGCDVMQSYCEYELLHKYDGPGQHVSYSDQAIGWVIRGSILQIIKTGPGTNPASYSKVTVVSSPRGEIGCGMNLTAHQHLVLMFTNFFVFNLIFHVFIHISCSILHF